MQSIKLSTELAVDITTLQFTELAVDITTLQFSFQRKRWSVIA